MSDNLGYDPDDDEGTSGDLVKDLRKQLNAANKALKQLRDAEKSKSIDKVLAKLPDGKREKAKKLIGDTDPEEWLEEYGELFGATETQSTTTESDELPAEAAVADTISQAVSSGEHATRTDSMRERFRDARSEEDMHALVQEEINRLGNAPITW